MRCRGSACGEGVPYERERGRCEEVEVRKRKQGGGEESVQKWEKQDIFLSYYIISLFPSSKHDIITITTLLYYCHYCHTFLFPRPHYYYHSPFIYYIWEERWYFKDIICTYFLHEEEEAAKDAPRFLSVEQRKSADDMSDAIRFLMRWYAAMMSAAMIWGGGDAISPPLCRRRRAAPPRSFLCAAMLSRFHYCHALWYDIIIIARDIRFDMPRFIIYYYAIFDIDDIIMSDDDITLRRYGAASSWYYYYYARAPRTPPARHTPWRYAMPKILLLLLYAFDIRSRCHVYIFQRCAEKDIIDIYLLLLLFTPKIIIYYYYYFLRQDIASTILYIVFW